jgi:hypothetical protein
MVGARYQASDFDRSIMQGHRFASAVQVGVAVTAGLPLFLATEGDSIHARLQASVLVGLAAMWLVQTLRAKLRYGWRAKVRFGELTEAATPAVRPPPIPRP